MSTHVAELTLWGLDERFLGYIEKRYQTIGDLQTATEAHLLSISGFGPEGVIDLKSSLRRFLERA